MRVVQLRRPVLVAACRVERVDLRHQAHGCVVKETAYDGGPLDHPARKGQLKYQGNSVERETRQ